MADICQPFLLCVITVESSAFKLLRDVWLTSILAISGEWVKIWGILSKKGELKRDKKLQKLADLLRKNEICDITFNRLMKVIGEYYGKDNARNKTI